MELSSSRFIAIELSEVEWQALRAIQPDPAAWVKEQIRELLDRAGYTPEPLSGATASSSLSGGRPAS